MKHLNGDVHLNATDLVGYTNCTYLAGLDLQVSQGRLAKPKKWDPFLDILRERGFRHEQAFIDHLKAGGSAITTIEGVDITASSVAATFAAMSAGAEIITQAALQDGRWSGRADILRKVETPSRFGSWSYEVTDTKLARETKGGTILQLCLYSDLLREMQGLLPETAYVVAPWTAFVAKPFRIADYAAYFRKAKLATELATSGQLTVDSYPEPIDHCDVCRWFDSCDKRRRDDDHLSFVAGISRNQMTELKENGVETLAVLAALPAALPWKPKRGAVQSYEKIGAQARIQLAAREQGELKFELLPLEPKLGLCMLPAPSEGDIFFDLEGDPFIGEHGLEYLFGYSYLEGQQELRHEAHWALDRAQEKEAFERFIDFVMAQRTTYPNLHIFHYAPYEPAALKRLMGRYATRESEIDDLLRGHVFVDLYSVVRNAVRASVESYSIKRLEAFYGYQRIVPLSEANLALYSLQAGLELADAASITDEEKQQVQSYNQDDCFSTLALRDWLEGLRAGLLADGSAVPRPDPPTPEVGEALSERQARVAALVQRLSDDIPVDEAERTNEQQAQWILANILDWHRREEKAVWWEHFRLAALSADELMDERPALARLTYIAEVPSASTRVPTHRYSFPQQDTDIRPDKTLRSVGGDELGKVAAISNEARTIDIKKTAKTASVHPLAIYTHEIVPGKEQADCLLRLGAHVADHGLAGDGQYRAARDLLLHLPPQLQQQPMQLDGEDTLSAAIRLARHMEGGVLPIQGPPGTGKSHTGARMICAFVEKGLKVGITANSHKVIRNLIDKVNEAAAELGLNLLCIQKPKEKEADQPNLVFAKDNPALIDAVFSGRCRVAGATAFFWAREDAQNLLDVLVVDEAAQMSLANVLAVSHAAKRLILLGDPQQLDQPTQGTHPDGTGVSAMQHILRDCQTIDSSQGLFLAQTWRMHPSICAFDSELFYEGKLHSVDGCQHQTILSDGPIYGSGLRHVAIEHSGNKSYSIEEAAKVMEVVMTILKSNSRWIDRDGQEKPIEMKDIIVITPYNAQVFEIQQRLPGVRVGTVDKFQGQEAPIAIYSMATSSHADAPRGMEFLYSSNRFNVAVSRAKCLSILISSPEIFEAQCKTPRQMQLANAFCRYVELSELA